MSSLVERLVIIRFKVWMYCNRQHMYSSLIQLVGVQYVQESVMAANSLNKKIND